MSIDIPSVLGRPLGTAAAKAASNPAAGAVKHDFRSLVLALQAGDIAGARKALDAVRKDLRTESGTQSAPTNTKSGVSVDDALDVLDQAIYARGHEATASADSQTIDYSKYSSMKTPYEVYMAIPNGLPPDWDWQQWADAAGQPNPGNRDVAGNELRADGFRADQPEQATPNPERPDFDWNQTGVWLAREGPDGSTHTLTINPPAGWSGTLELAGSQTASSLGGVSGVQYEVSDANGNVIASTGVQGSAGNGTRFTATGAQGPLTVTVTYVGAGRQTFNCLHQP